MARKTQLNLVVGINGTGKTTFIRQQVVERVRDGRLPKCLIVTPDPAEWRHLPTVRGAREVYDMQQTSRMVYESPEDLEAVCRSFYGGVLVLDDARAYIGAATPTVLNYLYIRRRQHGIDVYICTHGLSQVPPQCFNYASYLFLFATTDTFRSRAAYLDPEIYNSIMEHKRRIDSAARKGERYMYAVVKIDPTA